MARDPLDDAELERFFDAAKANAPAAGDDFMARLAADTEASVLKTQSSQPVRQNQSSFARLKGLFAASGLSGAAALGLWIGFAMPEIITTISPVSEDVTSISAFLAGADLSVLSE